MDTQYGRTPASGAASACSTRPRWPASPTTTGTASGFALATTLLRDGYFAFDRGDGLHGQLFWFPEYDVDSGEPRGRLPAGSASGTFRQNVYGAGTYSREFTNGTVIVNASAAPLEISFTSARTDASTGQVGTSFHLPAWDGRMYMKN